MLLGYVILNGVGLVHRYDGISDLAAMIAAVNLIPLFLGGRTNYLAEFLNIPLHTYYLVDHWVGRMVVIEALIQVIIVSVKRMPKRRRR